MASAGSKDDDSFNEAAGIPRGRLESPALQHIQCRASMRPRVFPAEDQHVTHRKTDTLKLQ